MNETINDESEEITMPTEAQKPTDVADKNEQKPEVTDIPQDDSVIKAEIGATQYEVVIEPLVIEVNGKKINGKLYSPVKDGKSPAVILSHGYNGGHSNYENEGKYFASKGFISYAFDFCGGSSWSTSSGSSVEMTVFTERADLVDVFDYISLMEQVDTGRIFLLGASQGGFVTTLAAEERADKVRALVLYYPALNIPDDWRGRYPNVDEIPEITDFWGVKLGKEFFTSIHDFYPFETINKFEKDVLIFQGDQDYIVSVSVAEKTAALYDNSELIVFPGQGHGFSPDVSETAMEHALGFMWDK